MVRAAEDPTADLVYAGTSLGVMPAQLPDKPDCLGEGHGTVIDGRSLPDLVARWTERLGDGGAGGRLHRRS